MSLRQLVSTVTGTVTGVASGGTVAGSAVFMGGQDAKVKALSALVSVTALTNTLTFKARWQVSTDNSTWYVCAGSPDNPANIALTTGVTPQVATPGIAVIPAPSSVEGWSYARMQLVVGGTTGTTNDTYSIGYSYRQFGAGDSG